MSALTFSAPSCASALNASAANLATFSAAAYATSAGATIAVLTACTRAEPLVPRPSDVHRNGVDTAIGERPSPTRNGENDARRQRLRYSG